jgi:hypothetical protein
MMSPVASPVSPELELPSVQRPAPLKSSSQDNADRVEYSSAGYYHEHDEVKMRMTNKDGDVFEVTGTFDYEAAYATRYSGPKGRGGDKDAAPAIDWDGDGKADKIGGAEWAKNVEREIRKQQMKLLEEAMKAFKPVDAGEGRFVMVVGVLYDSQETQGANAQEKTGVPDYWNAENTSNRIVQFATAFASLHGKDPEEFAKTIKQAIADGFDQAHGVTGDLPGAAGRLYNDTKGMVFAKLDKWLEDWKAQGYNQSAPLSEKSSEPAQAA